MNTKFQTANFNFEYKASTYTEKDAIEKGFKQLTGKELHQRIINKTIYGDYIMGYKFVSYIYDNGKTEGINHVGSQDFGVWDIDMEKHTLSIQWQNSWIDTLTHAYEVDGNIEFYDVDSGKWRTTFRMS